MTKPPDPIVILAGSLRRRSVSLAAARFVMAELDGLGRPVQLATVAELNLPPFNPDLHRADLSVSRALLGMARSCGGMIWSAPAYNGSVGGGFKNVLDYLDLLSEDTPAFLMGKPVGLIAASGGIAAAVNAITTLDMVVRALRGNVIPYSVPIVRANSLLSDDLTLSHEPTLEMLRLLAREVARRGVDPGA